MENNLFERFPCRVTQHMCRRRSSYPKDRKEDQSRRKGVEHHYRGHLNEHTSDPLHNLHRRIVFRNFHSYNWFFKILVRILSVGSRAILQRIVKLYKKHGKRYDAHATHVEHMETPYDETATDPFGDMEISYHLW